MSDILPHLITYLQQLNPIWVYVALFMIAYVENIFPPSPSDVIIIAGGYLVGTGQIDFLTTLLVVTLGSTAGFMTMYKIGDWFGLKIIEKGKLKFLPLDAVHKVENWFRHYGYWLIVANRFLSGTRAIISFFAGMSEINFTYSSALSFISAFVWNGILIYLGTLLGKNWELIESYLATYSQIVLILILISITVGIIWWYKKRREKID